MDSDLIINMAQGEKKIKLYSRSEAETREIGKVLSFCLMGKEIIFLVGDLGAGKTVFVKGIAEGAGVKKRVRSSSFVLLSQYRGESFPLYHLDLYRITPNDFMDLCIDDFLGEGVILIEWADKIKDILKPDLCVKIKIIDENTRSVEISGCGEVIDCLRRELIRNARFSN